MGTRHLGLAAALAVTLLAGCQTFLDEMWDDEDGEETGEGRLQVTPDELFFGTVDPNASLTLPLTLRNIGSGPLTLASISLDAPGVFALSDVQVDAWLPPGGTTTVPVQYTALEADHHSGMLTIVTDDPSSSHFFVPVSGVVLAPMIELDPWEWDFGDHEIGCEQEQEITIRNVGTAPLDLQSLVFSPTSDELQLSFYFPEGTILGPNQEQVATVHYSPVDAQADTGYLHVYSNDPWNPNALATQQGDAHLTDAVVDEYVQQADAMIDILWMVDNSGSMTDDVPDILAGIQGPWTTMLDALGLDYQQEILLADTEHLLQYPYELLTPPLNGPGSPLYGFERPDAGLRMMIVSDEDDQSPDTVATYVSQYQSLKSDPGMVILNAVSGGAKGCASPPLEAAPAPRLVQATLMTGGYAADFCGDWVTELSSLLVFPSPENDTFELSQDPIPSTIGVELDGVPATTGWVYEEALNAVIFGLGDVPAPGVAITIRYHLEGTCEG